MGEVKNVDLFSAQGMGLWGSTIYTGNTVVCAQLLLSCAHPGNIALFSYLTSGLWRAFSGYSFHIWKVSASAITEFHFFLACSI